MNYIFQRFIDDLEESKDIAALRRLMSRTADALDLGKFAYLGFKLNGQGYDVPLAISTYPEEWADHYFEQRYDRIDPVVARAITDVLPFSWSVTDRAADLSRKQVRFLKEAGEFGIVCGFTTPIHDRQGKVATLTFASEGNDADFLRTVEQNRHVIHLMAIYFHAHVRQGLQNSTYSKRCSLSPREIDCLQWAARGKSSGDISDILTISRRTVIFHLENAKRKLEVASLQQAIVRALLEDIISS